MGIPPGIFPLPPAAADQAHPFMWCGSCANLAVSSVRGRVEQSRSVLELAPTATISPVSEKATERTTWALEQAGSEVCSEQAG